MTWKEKTICRILLIIARMLADGDTKDRIETLSTHIAVARIDE